jgi:peptide/nickel transport system permease protein
MARFLLRRLALLVPVLFAVTFFSYLLLDLLPTDVTIVKLGPNATEEAVEQLREELNLNDPLPVRYGKWVGDLFQGDLGRSFLNNQPVWEALRQRIGVTLELLIGSQIVALGIAIPVALLAARRPGGIVDRVSTGASFMFLAIPNFILAVLLVFLVALKLGWLPATGLPAFAEDPGEHFRSLILPVFSLALAELAVYVRLLRTDMIATLQEDYILNARAKGLPSWYIMLRHAFRPSSFSLLTVAGLNMARLIGGTLIIELIFAIPGMGELAVKSIYSRDYPIVQGFVVIVAVGYVLINFAVDILYSILDPRTRHARAHA